MTVRWPVLSRLPRLLVVLHDLAVVVVVWLLLHWLARQAGAPPAAALRQWLDGALAAGRP